MAAPARVGLIAGAIEQLRMLRHRAHAARLAQAGGGQDAMRQWQHAYGQTVTDGPFRGMRYTPRWGDASALGKLVGSYESELHPVIDRLLRRAPERIVVIGSAEGYYSVGCARAVPTTRIDAFDTDVLARWNTVKLAKDNGVSRRVHVHGEANPNSLAAVLACGPALIICDCEGYEDILLNPQRTPALAACDILVELHEQEHKHLGEDIAARFPDSVATFTLSADRHVADYASLTVISEPLRSLALREFRYAQRWLVLRAPTT